MGYENIGGKIDLGLIHNVINATLCDDECYFRYPGSDKRSERQQVMHPTFMGTIKECETKDVLETPREERYLPAGKNE